MLIIFQPNVNKNPRVPWLQLLIITISLTCIHTQQSTEVKYSTPFTKCEMIFTRIANSSNQNSSLQSQYAFSNCKMSRCITLGTGSQCKEYSSIGLEELDCYWSCCRTRHFDEGLCDQNNAYLAQQSKTMDEYLIIILAICCFALVLVILFFVINDLRCLEKQTEFPPNEVTPAWKQAKYEDHKCHICEQYGAIIETYCKHYFHLECFKKGVGNKAITGQCLACDEISKKYRFWCGQCHQKYIKIGYYELKTMDKIELYYHESLALHDDCLKDLFCYAKTDLRLTSTTND